MEHLAEERDIYVNTILYHAACDAPGGAGGRLGGW